MTFGLLGRQILARGADHGGDLQLEVEPGAAGEMGTSSWGPMTLAVLAK